MSVTIVIASYKYGHLAAHAIDSVISQTVKPDNILFVDDAVGDCTHLKKLYPEVNFILRETNLGTVANFQDMLDRVWTDQVMFLGADNWLRQDTLEKLSEQGGDIITYDIQVVGTQAKEILHRHQDQVRPHEGGYYWDRSSGHHGSMLYNAKLAKEVGGYAPSGNGRTEEDMVLYNRMIKGGGTRVHVPESFLYYRRHRENFNPC